MRRVVTGHDQGGKAVVLFDGEAPNVRRRPGVVSSLLWVTDESPADVSGRADRAAREIGIPPPPRGTIFRVVEFLPQAQSGAPDGEAMFRGTGVERPAGARHPSMHRTRSIDYAIVLEGEIDMLLDDSEVRLRAGDVVVQQGTNHGWVNRAGKPCRIAFVLMDAQEAR